MVDFKCVSYPKQYMLGWNLENIEKTNIEKIKYYQEMRNFYSYSAFVNRWNNNV